MCKFNLYTRPLIKMQLTRLCVASARAAIRSHLYTNYNEHDLIILVFSRFLRSVIVIARPSSTSPAEFRPCLFTAHIACAHTPTRFSRYETITVLLLLHHLINWKQTIFTTRVINHAYPDIIYYCHYYYYFFHRFPRVEMSRRVYALCYLRVHRGYTRLHTVCVRIYTYTRTRRKLPLQTTTRAVIHSAPLCIEPKLVLPTKPNSSVIRLKFNWQWYAQMESAARTMYNRSSPPARPGPAT